MKIGNREVGPGAPVFVISDVGSNHGGSLDRALALIDAAAEAGADAAKFQRFRVGQFLVPRPNEVSLRKYELPDEWLPDLAARCKSRGIAFLCTPFDYDALTTLAPFVDAWKIGSYEAPHRAFVQAAKRKWPVPLIASEGLAPAPPETDIALRCMSAYPAQITSYLTTRPGGCWGVSDHTLDPLTVPAAAVALGACVVEKHMMKFGQPETPDTGVSIDQFQFAEMVRAIRNTEKAVRG